MAEARSNKSLTNKNEMTESEIEVAEQLIHLSMIGCKRKKLNQNQSIITKMAETRSNKSLTSSNENEMTELEIEVVEQLIQLSMINYKKKNMMTLEEELEVDDEAVTKMKSQPTKNHQKKKMKYRFLVDIYKTTTPI
ncbi:hypothetical protein TSUD_318990 [Trifolium subterraneum]|uniref:Uncharacterized protein n=1 Tax=Trifolium subterraneum TaxID=3900 RepID=A0A2Z6MZR3_TRISU|nr:hypothetical protein TSUD_318990 [Trifolium subterraneum]